MADLETLREWFAFNARSRRGYFAALRKLPHAELARDRGASFPSMLEVLQHSIGAYRFWLERVSPTALGPAPAPPGAERTLAEVERYDTQVWPEVQRFLDLLTEDGLRRTIHLEPGGPFSRRHTLSVRDVLWHLVEEELQHRGELNALLWQIDVEAPVFDWIDWVETPPDQGGPTQRPRG